MPLLRRARAVAIGSALLATGCLTVPQLAHADPDPGVPAGCVQGGPTLRYLVVFAKGTAEQDAGTQVSGACGFTAGYYPQIAVAVATSSDPSFPLRIGPDRVYSAQAQAYDDADQRPGSSHKSDELIGGGSPGVTADPRSVPTVNRTGEQWDMAMIKAQQAHRITEGSPKVLVGVLDSGIDPNHPGLAAELDRSASAGCVTGVPDPSEAAWAPTTSAHGTHVAGTIAAADDGHGIAGVAPGVRVASVKVVNDAGYIYPEAAVCGFMWAAQQGMTLTNNSYYVDPWVFTCQNTPGQRVIYEAIQRAVGYASAHGVLNIAAAGNAGADLTNPGQDSRSPDNVGSGDQQPRQLGEDCGQLPAALHGVLTVSAVGANQVKAGYSSYGLGAVDLTAPGGDVRQRAPGGQSCVLSTVPDGYASSCGTSMAAPHATGVAALLASTHPNATPGQLTALLDGQADPVACPADYDLNGTGVQDAYCTGDTTYNSFYGHGMVDALTAVTTGWTPSSTTTAAATTSAPPQQPPAATGARRSPWADDDPVRPRRRPMAATPTPAPVPVPAPIPAAAPNPSPPVLLPAVSGGASVGGPGLLGAW